MVHRNINGAMQYHKLVIRGIIGLFACETGEIPPPPGRERPRKPTDHHPCPDLRHFTLKYDDAALSAVKGAERR
jgi:hypothetical protein